MVTSTTNKYKVGSLVLAPLGFKRFPGVITKIYHKGKLCLVTFMHPSYCDLTTRIDYLELLCE